MVGGGVGLGCALRIRDGKRDLPRKVPKSGYGERRDPRGNRPVSSNHYDTGSPGIAMMHSVTRVF